MKQPLPEGIQKKIKPCPIDFLKIAHLIQRAKKDLATAQLIQEADLEAAYQLLYDGMLHTALAYMMSDGMQPDIHGKHKTVIEYIEHALGNRFKSKIEFYDRMRRKRHQFLYEPGWYQCTETEVIDAEGVVVEFIDLIYAKIKEKYPDFAIS
ncbi:MAG: HEPN domain-containing protein [Candidatus Omnitrophica bacterium]|nr:HEPN domain-containing protein [Candidatus Omnitrophota bacterium]